MRRAGFAVTALIAGACASVDDTPAATSEAPPARDEESPPALAISEERARFCAPQILAVGGIAQGQAAGAEMFAASRDAYANAASWVTFYEALDPVQGIEEVLRRQTEATQAEARRIVEGWSAEAEEGASMTTLMTPAITCIAEFRIAGLPPALPGMAATAP